MLLNFNHTVKKLAPFMNLGQDGPDLKNKVNGP